MEDTPIKKVFKKDNEINVPASPFLKRLGYGSGVDVYTFERSPVGNNTRSPWAIKMLRKNEKSTLYGTRLQKEAELLRKLNHPHIVGFRAFAKTPTGDNCLAMELATTSLADLIETRSEDIYLAFPPSKILKMGLDIAKALDYLHIRMLILHGDIKSHNVLIVGDFENCKLCDFGVSLPLKRDGTVDFEKAGESAEYIGTLAWTAPEIFKHHKNITTKTDIFAFGFVFWEMMALEIPHGSDDILEDEDTNHSVEEYYPFGTRPAVPYEMMQDIEEYYHPLELFYYCTVEEPAGRPTAYHLTLSIYGMLHGTDDDDE